MQLSSRETTLAKAFVKHQGEWSAFCKEVDLPLYVAQMKMKELSRKAHIYHRERKYPKDWAVKLGLWLKTAEEFQAFLRSRDPMDDPAF